MEILNPFCDWYTKLTELAQINKIEKRNLLILMLTANHSL